MLGSARLQPVMSTSRKTAKPKKAVIPTQFPADLHADVRAAARETRLSQSAAIRQAVRFGLPILRARMAGTHAG